MLHHRHFLALLCLTVALASCTEHKLARNSSPQLLKEDCLNLPSYELDRILNEHRNRQEKTNQFHLKNFFLHKKKLPARNESVSEVATIGLNHHVVLDHRRDQNYICPWKRVVESREDKWPKYVVKFFFQVTKYIYNKKMFF